MPLTNVNDNLVAEAKLPKGWLAARAEETDINELMRNALVLIEQMLDLVGQTFTHEGMNMKVLLRKHSPSGQPEYFDDPGEQPGLRSITSNQTNNVTSLQNVSLVLQVNSLLGPDGAERVRTAVDYVLELSGDLSQHYDADKKCVSNVALYNTIFKSLAMPTPAPAPAPAPEQEPAPAPEQEPAQ